MYSSLSSSGAIKFSESTFRSTAFSFFKPSLSAQVVSRDVKIIFIFYYSFLVLFFIFFYAYISLMSKEHHYTQHELSPFFLYTPESLRNLPNISNVAEYSYYYNVDDMQTRVIVTWRNIDNIFLQKAKLIDFLKRMGPSLQNDCIWFFHDKSDYANNFQRYCIIEHRDSLQVEYFETIE